MDNVLKINIPEIKKDEYKNAASDPELATKFWNKNNPVPRELLNLGLYHTLREHLFTLLRLCKDIDPVAYDIIHKGHPFFFIGISSFRLRDYQTAISFFDAALSEDLEIEDSKERPTDLFFLLKGDNPKNAAQIDTKLVQLEVNRSINKYNELISQNNNIKKFDIDKLRDNFISYVLENYNDPGLRTLLTTFITFIAEWEFRDSNFELGIKKGTAEPLFMHLFRGCLLFESLLLRNPKHKPGHKKEDLFNLIDNYRECMGLKKDWKLIHHKEEFKPLEKLLIHMNEFRDTIDYSILISYWLRNNLGHNIGWKDTIDREAYNKLYLFVSSACLHVINCLWDSPK